MPLSLAWTGELLVLATEARSATVRNLAATGRARLGLGATRDVVMVDAVVEGAPVDVAVVDAFVAQADWDPREAPEGTMTFLVLRPTRIQAWREANEIAGRTVFRDGRWLA